MVLLSVQSDCLMEVALIIGIVSFSMPGTPTGLVTTLKLVTMVSMRLPESETMKLCVPVPVRTAAVLSKTAPMHRPPRYWLKLLLPDPVAGSNEVVVLTLFLVLFILARNAGDMVPKLVLASGW